MRRANIPIAYSAGFNPHMIMSFASPLGIGLTSQGEYLDIELKQAIDSALALQKLNQHTVNEIELLEFRQIASEKKHGAMTILAACDYRFKLNEPLIGLADKIVEFLEKPAILVTKQTKRSEAEIDLRPLIYQFIALDEQSIFMKLAAGSVQNVKPQLVWETFCQVYNIEMNELLQYERLEMYAKQDDNLVALGALGTEINEGN